MNNKQYYVDIAIKAAKRAAHKIAEKARKENCPLPVWKKDHIEFEVPSYTQQANPEERD